MKQTAVEWLVKEYHLPQDSPLVQQAKEMEKERIIKGYANGHNDGCRYMNNEKQQFEHGEQYYKQTYGGGEQ